MKDGDKKDRRRVGDSRNRRGYFRQRERRGPRGSRFSKDSESGDGTYSALVQISAVNLSVKLD